jgi:UDP-N-acetylmuramyl pentapeptide phosphotransferase/UDP-N-acetylglucosamine-1-phosphate transferase
MLLVAMVAGGLCAATLFALLRWRPRFVPLDRPNARSLHDAPVPRAGGIALMLGIAAAWTLIPGAAWLPMWIAAGLCAVSYFDDVRGLPVAARLSSHVLAAALVVPAAFPGIGWSWAAAFVLATVWMVNLYNFMDGSDGLAGGMAVIGFCAYGLGARAIDPDWLASASFAVAAAAGAFLAFNFHPARIFLGDSGSIPLGFLAAVLGLYGIAEGAWPYWFPLLVFAPFIGDATVTLIRRLARRERVWHAHRDHYYQRLVRMGLGHRGTACVAYAAMVVCAGCALWARDKSATLQLATFALVTLLLGLAAATVDLRWARFNRERRAT